MYSIPEEDILFIHDGDRLIGVSTEIGDDFDDYLVLSEVSANDIKDIINKNINEFTFRPSFEETTGADDEMDAETDE